MDYQQESRNRAIAYVELTQMSGWNFLKAYINEQIEVATKRFLSGEPIDDSLRYEIVGLVKLLNHVEEALKKVNE